ncbi:MAG: hypothetical protein DWQ07_01510 [Chloroflexi bacterium]|nr:MAG: hypothetical protein DWQ07_01510 [Chloroflexota bacterium]MBL1193826.1 hypothetical protein [Chloroflexota bacterium]NOH11120.1 hypothetical protein [Chloroflexota bacterium]
MRTYNDLTTEEQRLLEFVEDIAVEGMTGSLFESEDYPVCTELASLKPDPRKDFQRQLKARLHERIKKQNKANRDSSRRKVAVPVLMLLLLVFFLLATPGGNAFASAVIQGISQFFTRAESDTITIIATAPARTPTATSSTSEDALPDDPPLVEGLDYYESRYIYGLDEALAITAFDIREPAYLPPGFSFIGARHDEEKNSIHLLYVFPHHAPIMDAALMLTKFSGPFAESGFGQIGPATEVTTILIGDIEAEYVVGGWLYVQDPSVPTAAPGDIVIQEFHWEHRSVPSQTLRWMKNGFLFQINFNGSDLGEGSLGLKDLIRIAETWE